MRRFAYVVVGAGSLALAGQALAETDSATVTVTAQTEPALSVSCPDGLRFGTLAIASDATAADVTITAASGNTGTITGTGVVQIGSPGPGRCLVENAKTAATASLSAGTVSLSDGAAGTLSATVSLDKTTVAIGSDVVFVGGTLTIPLGHSNHGVEYTGSVTFTVTD